MKRKIYITLIGGLGNQLFQYACAFNLASNLNAKLIIDDRGGFFLIKNLKDIIHCQKIYYTKRQIY